MWPKCIYPARYVGFVGCFGLFSNSHPRVTSHKFVYIGPWKEIKI